MAYLSVQKLRPVVVMIGAARYERTDTRVIEHNRFRPRTRSTKAGGIDLRIPKLHKGSFFPLILEPRRRIDQSLCAVLMAAYVAGVSTRSVDDLVAALGLVRQLARRRMCGELNRCPRPVLDWQFGATRRWLR